MRIFNAVQHHHERMFSLFRRKNLVQVRIFLFRRDRDHTLMSGTARQPVQILTRQKTHGDSRSAAFINHFLHPAIMPLAGNANVFESPAARLQRLCHGVDSVHHVHISSLMPAVVS